MNIPEAINFRCFSGTIEIYPEDFTYEMLAGMDEGTWRDYLAEMTHWGVSVDYNLMDDYFVVKGSVA